MLTINNAEYYIQKPVNNILFKNIKQTQPNTITPNNNIQNQYNNNMLGAKALSSMSIASIALNNNVNFGRIPKKTPKLNIFREAPLYNIHDINPVQFKQWSEKTSKKLVNIFEEKRDMSKWKNVEDYVNGIHRSDDTILWFNKKTGKEYIKNVKKEIIHSKDETMVKYYSPKSGELYKIEYTSKNGSNITASRNYKNENTITYLDYLQTNKKHPLSHQKVVDMHITTGKNNIKYKSTQYVSNIDINNNENNFVKKLNKIKGQINRQQ